MYVLVTACMPRGLLQLSPLQLQKELAVHEGCCHIGPRPWAPSLSVVQLKSAGASVIACMTCGSSACFLFNSNEYLQCKQVIVTACTTRGLCFPVRARKIFSVPVAEMSRVPFIWSHFLSSWSQSCAKTQKFRRKKKEAFFEAIFCTHPDTNTINEMIASSFFIGNENR